MEKKDFSAKQAAEELLDKAADLILEEIEKDDTLAKAMKAKQVIMEEGRPPQKGWKYGKRKVGSWVGPNPNGAVVDDMRSLDMKTGEVTMHGPKGELPGEDKKPKVLAQLKGEMDKTSPENMDQAQVQKLDVPQPDAPKAQEKLIDKKPLQLKKFMEGVSAKKMSKNAPAAPPPPPPPPSSGTINSKIGFPFGKKESK